MADRARPERTHPRRQNGCDVHLKYAAISRRHATLALQEGGSVRVSPLPASSRTGRPGATPRRAHAAPARRIDARRSHLTPSARRPRASIPRAPVPAALPAPRARAHKLTRRFFPPPGATGAPAQHEQDQPRDAQRRGRHRGRRHAQGRRRGGFPSGRVRATRLPLPARRRGGGGGEGFLPGGPPAIAPRRAQQRRRRRQVSRL